MGLLITQTTKAGSNEVHGTVHDLYQPNAWRAMTHFQGLTYRYQQSLHGCNHGGASPSECLGLKYKYGNPGVFTNVGSASFGGPVFIPHLYDGRNKLFFFVFFDNDNQNTASVGTVSLPTMRERSGDFSDLPSTTSGIPASYVAACGTDTPYYGQYQLYNPFTVTLDANGVPRRQPFCGNLIPAALLSANSKMSAIYNQLLPAPSSNSPLGSNYTYTSLARQPFRQFTERMDYALSQNDHFYFRWTREHLTQTVTGFATDGAQDRYQQKWIALGALGWNHIFNASTDLNVTVGASSFDAACCVYPGYDKYSPSSVGLPDYLESYAGATPTLPVFSVSGYQQVGNMDNTPQIYRNLSFSGTLTRVQGRHTLRAGAEWQQQSFSQAAQGTASGTYAFDDTYTSENNGTDNTYPRSNTGLSYAALLLGIPTTSTVEQGTPTSIRTPYYSLFAADTWRIARKLTLNFGLRFEYEFGPSEEKNTQIVGWDPTAALPISAPVNAAYSKTLAAATAAQQAILPASLPIQGGPVYAGVNGASRHQFVNNYRILPRVAAAYQFKSKTVFRVGYGIYSDTINAHGQASGANPHPGITGGTNQWGGVQFATNQDGYNASTSVASSSTFGTNFVAGTTPLSDPFPVVNGSRFNMPTGNAAGAMYYAGSSATLSDHGLVPARAQRWYGGMQHQFGESTLVEVAYLGQFVTNMPISVPVSHIPASFYRGGTQPNVANNSLLAGTVSNPFMIGNLGSIADTDPAAYGLMAHNKFFTGPTIAVSNLMRSFPQMTGLSIYESVGRSKFQEVQVNAVKRSNNGLTFIGGLQINDQYDQDYFANSFDSLPSWEPSNNSTPYRVTGQVIYRLPFGAGRAWANSGWESKIFGGFQLAGTYERQPGWLLAFNNLFYIGDPSQDIKLKHPVYVDNLASGGSAYVQWLNPGNVTATYSNGTCTYSGTGFVRNSSCEPDGVNLRVFPTHVEGVRGPATDTVQANVQRTFSMGERFNLDMRIEAYNLLNRQYLGFPNVTPTSAQFGQISSDGPSSGPGNSRWLSIEARLRF